MAMSTARASTSPPSANRTTCTGPAARTHDLPGQHRLGAEPGRLRDGPVGEVGAGHALGEAEVVLDGRALPGLPARRVALDDDGAQPLGRRVHGGGQPGRAAADDAQVVQRLLRPGAQAERVGELDASSGAQRVALGQEHERQVVRRRPRRARAAARPPRRAPGRPAVRDVVAGQEHLDVVAAVGPQVADHPHDRRSSGWSPARPRAGRRRPGRAALGRLPRLEQVVVEADVVDRADGHVGVRVGREQQQPGVGECLADLPSSSIPVMPGIRWSETTRATGRERSVSSPGRRGPRPPTSPAPPGGRRRSATAGRAR